MVRKTKAQARETRLQIIEAARGVFHRRGVSRASLEMVAEAAGLTRGAIYWHFKDKAELFRAVRENVLFPALADVDAIVDSDRYADPLDAIEAALVRFFEILGESDNVRAVLETLARRCEHVDEFADVHAEVDGRTTRCLAKLQVAYGRAAATGVLRSRLDPGFLARDTWAFAYGLMYRLLTGDADSDLQRHVGKMIAFHMTLRRSGQPRPGKDINMFGDN